MSAELLTVGHITHLPSGHLSIQPLTEQRVLLDTAEADGNSVSNPMDVTEWPDWSTIALPPQSGGRFQYNPGGSIWELIALFEEQSGSLSIQAWAFPPLTTLRLSETQLAGVTRPFGTIALGIPIPLEQLGGSPIEPIQATSALTSIELVPETGSGGGSQALMAVPSAGVDADEFYVSKPVYLGGMAGMYGSIFRVTSLSLSQYKRALILGRILTGTSG